MSIYLLVCLILHYAWASCAGESQMQAHNAGLPLASIWERGFGVPTPPAHRSCSLRLECLCSNMIQTEHRRPSSESGILAHDRHMMPMWSGPEQSWVMIMSEFSGLATLHMVVTTPCWGSKHVLCDSTGRGTLGGCSGFPRLYPILFFSLLIVLCIRLLLSCSPEYNYVPNAVSPTRESSNLEIELGTSTTPTNRKPLSGEK